MLNRRVLVKRRKWSNLLLSHTSAATRFRHTKKVYKQFLLVTYTNTKSFPHTETKRGLQVVQLEPAPPVFLMIWNNFHHCVIEPNAILFWKFTWGKPNRRNGFRVDGRNCLVTNVVTLAFSYRLVINTIIMQHMIIHTRIFRSLCGKWRKWLQIK